MASNGYLGGVFSNHDDANTDSLLKMLSDVEDRTSKLMHQVQEMIVATYGEFTQVPREARVMTASSRVIAEHLEILEAEIKTIAIPKLKNSTGVLNDLSKRISEITLTRNIVDELIALNHVFVVGQDHQREKKYFDAVKSFQTLHVNLENASNDVKELNIFPILMSETTQSRANLLELMTASLEMCFQCQATPGIDVSKTTYFTLKVAKNFKDDMEESFQALHYLEKLDIFFVVFAEWVKKNILLTIILNHCTVTSEDEDGKFMVLKIEVDYTLPKCDYMKVFENLSFAFAFLNTYLSITVGANHTLMRELGKLTSEDFTLSLISDCLAETIPSHSNQLEGFKTVISALEKFHGNLKTIGYLDERNSELASYSTNAEKLCAEKTAKLLLIRARDIIKKDLYDVMEVEIVPEALVATEEKNVPVKVEEVPDKNAPDRILEEHPSKEYPDKYTNMPAEMEELKLDFLKYLDEDSPGGKNSEPELIQSIKKEKINKESPLHEMQQKNKRDLEEIKSSVKPEAECLVMVSNPDSIEVPHSEVSVVLVSGKPKNPPIKTTQEDTVDESSDEEIIFNATADKAILESVNETNFNLSGAIYAFPKCQISKSANELISLLNEVLNDCVGSSSDCARNLFKTARNIVELFCAIAPIYHKKYLETIPQQAALFHNNCLYMAHCLLTMGHLQRMLLPEGVQTIGSFADQVSVLRNKGVSVFLAHMQIQRNQILDIIRNCGLSTLGECSTLTPETERALRQCLRQLELLKSVWQPVLPINVYLNTMACLVNSFLDELINRVVTLQDIPAETASQLVKMFGVVLTRIKAILPDSKMLAEFKKWEMFQELVLILGASMALIKDRWANGSGPAANHFSSEQLRRLIRALFQNTERRAAILAEVH